MSRTRFFWVEEGLHIGYQGSTSLGNGAAASLTGGRSSGTAQVGKRVRVVVHNPVSMPYVRLFMDITDEVCQVCCCSESCKHAVCTPIHGKY